MTQEIEETFDDAIASINVQGWNLYSLEQTSVIELSYHPDTPLWRCTLREIANKPRCEILYGRGPTPVSALHNALGSASELERENAISGMLEANDEPTPESTEPKLMFEDIAKLFLKREPINRRL